MHTAFLLNVFHLYVKFEVTSFFTLEVMPWTKIRSLNLQRSKVVGLELRFLHTTLLNVTYLCVKFEVITFNTFEVMPRTRFNGTQTEGQMDGGTDRRTNERTG